MLSGSNCTNLFAHKLRQAHTRLGVYALDDTGSIAMLSFCRQMVVLGLHQVMRCRGIDGGAKGMHEAISQARLFPRASPRLARTCAAIIVAGRQLDAADAHEHGRCIGQYVRPHTLLVLECDRLGEEVMQRFASGVQATSKVPRRDLQFAFAPLPLLGDVHLEQLGELSRFVCAQDEGSLRTVTALYAQAFPEVIPMLGLSYANSLMLQDVQTSLCRRVVSPPGGALA